MNGGKRRANNIIKYLNLYKRLKVIINKITATIYKDKKKIELISIPQNCGSDAKGI
ncbi:MAG: hypothetical protein KAT05_10935 [Spirochaetes bacterium]|nr:hypothetical protein [Spirochaetota bacterium]